MDQLAHHQPLHIAADEYGVVVLFGELDSEGGRVLDRALASSEVRSPVELDVGAVTFVDSAGLRALLLIALREEADGRRVTLRNPASVLIRLLTITGTMRQFDIVP
jgi:anti-anti-sigma factor